MRRIGLVIDAMAEPVPVAPPRKPPPGEPKMAHPNAIAGWLLTLANTRMRGKPGSPGELSEEINDIIFTCGDLPAGCWTETTLKQAKGHFEWWPGPAQLKQFLEPIADVERTNYRITEAKRSFIPARSWPSVTSYLRHPLRRVGGVCASRATKIGSRSSRPGSTRQHATRRARTSRRWPRNERASRSFDPPMTRARGRSGNWCGRSRGGNEHGRVS